MWALIVTSFLVFGLIVFIQLGAWIPAVFIGVCFCAAGLRALNPPGDS